MPGTCFRLRPQGTVKAGPKTPGRGRGEGRWGHRRRNSGAGGCTKYRLAWVHCSKQRCVFLCNPRMRTLRKPKMLLITRNGCSARAQWWTRTRLAAHCMMDRIPPLGRLIWMRGVTCGATSRSSSAWPKWTVSSHAGAGAPYGCYAPALEWWSDDE